jgi:hypothetical protein
MKDERVSLEHRIAWLEREMVRLLWAAIGALSLLAGGIAYRLTVDNFGDLAAFGFAFGAWLIVGWYLHRHELRGAPEHVKDMDP